MECICTVSYSILINGKLARQFQAQKGHRQGDLMSSFLFLLGKENLSRSLDSLQDHPNFSFHPSYRKVGLTHIMFTDDKLLFCKGELKVIETLMKAFHIFS